jgi:hypothetical protein
VWYRQAVVAERERIRKRRDLGLPDDTAARAERARRYGEVMG